MLLNNVTDIGLCVLGSEIILVKNFKNYPYRELYGGSFKRFPMILFSKNTVQQ